MLCEDLEQIRLSDKPQTHQHLTYTTPHLALGGQRSIKIPSIQQPSLNQLLTERCFTGLG
jgi:hypothetical protein